MFHFVPLRCGEVLFYEWQFDAEEGNPLYFLYRGCVEAVVSDKDGVDQVVARIEQGRFFGEVGMLVHMPRTATIRGASDCILLELKAADFHNFLQLAPEALSNFRKKLTDYSISLKHLIHSPLALHYYIKHLEREYSAENIHFWIEANEFRLTVDDGSEFDRQSMIARAQEIFDQYIRNGAPDQVNINGIVQAEITAAMKAGNITRQAFSKAEQEILELMDRDSFARFKQSALFQEFLNHINHDILERSRGSRTNSIDSTPLF